MCVICKMWCNYVAKKIIKSVEVHIGQDIYRNYDRCKRQYHTERCRPETRRMCEMCVIKTFNKNYSSSSSPCSKLCITASL